MNSHWSHSPRVSRLMPLALLALLAVVILAARWHTFYEPLERDITTYAVIAHGMIEGRPLYSEMWDLKPPAIFWAYVVAELIAGYGPASIYLLGVGAAIVTLIGVYLAGVTLSGKLSGGLWAAAFWTIICHDLYLQANQPNTEVFINACLVWAFVLIVRSDARSFAWRQVVAAGVLFALASLFKQVALIMFAFLAIAHIGTSSVAHERRRATAQAAVMFAVIIALWLCVSLYFAAVGSWMDYYDTLFVIGREYVGDPLANLMVGLRPSNLYPSTLYFTAPLLVMAVFALLAGYRQGRMRASALLMGYGLAVPLAVALPGQFHPHYYQLWLPLLAIGAGWGVAELNTISVARGEVISVATGAIVGLILFCYEAPNFLLTPEDWSRMKYTNTFIEEKHLASEINRMLKPDETFYEYGNEPGFYWYSQRRPPSGIINIFPLSQGPLTDYFSNRLVRDLRHRSPDLFILAKASPLSRSVADFLGDDYTLMPNTPDDSHYYFLVRHGSDLERRMSQGMFLPER